MANNNTPDTMLVQTKIRGTDKPDGYFAATLQNAYYRIRIHYMDMDYRKHKLNNDFKPSDIHVAAIPLKDDAPQITCAMSSDKMHAIAIDTNPLCPTIFESEIDGYIDSLKAAKATIEQLKEAIRRYFGEDMI